MYYQGPSATACKPYTIVLVYNSGTVSVHTLTTGETNFYGGTASYSSNVPVFEPAPPRRARRPQQPAEVRPWRPKRVLREAIASWATSVRAFAGR